MEPSKSKKRTAPDGATKQTGPDGVKQKPGGVVAESKIPEKPAPAIPRKAKAKPEPEIKNGAAPTVETPARKKGKAQAATPVEVKAPRKLPQLPTGQEDPGAAGHGWEQVHLPPVLGGDEEKKAGAKGSKKPDKK